MEITALASCLDYARHAATTTLRDVEKQCQAVIRYGFHSAFVNPCFVVEARQWLLETPAAVGTVISFPLGQDSRDQKLMTAIDCVRKGADELDISMNLGWFKEQKYKAWFWG